MLEGQHRERYNNLLTLEGNHGEHYNNVQTTVNTITMYKPR